MFQILENNDIDTSICAKGYYTCNIIYGTLYTEIYIFK